MRRVAVALVLALTLSCARSEVEIPPLGPSDYDLVAQIAYADVRREERWLNVAGGDVGSTPMVGFSGTEEWGKHEFTWGLGRTQEVQFFLSRPRDITLQLEAWLPDAAPESVRSLRVLVNDTEIGQVRVSAKRPGKAIELTVPSQATRQRSNHVVFEHIADWSPVDALANGDNRRLSLAWRRIGLDGVDEGKVAGDVEARALSLTDGVEVDYHVEVAPGASLAWAGVTGKGQLEVVFESPDGDPSTWPLDPTGGEIRLGAESKHPATVRLRATSGSAEMTLHGPVLKGLTEGEISFAEVGELTAEIEVPARLPNLLVYMIDTLRADRLAAYGNDRGLTPNLDALARDSLVFSDVVAVSSWTRPTVASILTGLSPLVHTAQAPEDGLPKEVDTLAEIVGREGFRTAAFLTNNVVGEDYGFGQGYDFISLHRERLKTPEVHTRASVVHGDFLGWLDRRDEADPFYAYLHVTEPHAPYTPSPRSRSLFAPSATGDVGLHASVEELTQGRREPRPGEAAALRDLYDAEIHDLDQAFGRFMTDLEARDLLEETVVVVLADHGEEFGEHGRWQHGLTLYPEQLHVPLLIRLPRRVYSSTAGARIGDMASQVDVLPTLLGILGLEIPDGLDGRPLVKVAGRGSRRSQAFSWLDKGGGRELESVRIAERLIVHNQRYDQPRHRYERVLWRDTDGLLPIEAALGVTDGYARSQLRRQRADTLSRAFERREIVLDETQRSELEALGYLDG